MSIHINNSTQEVIIDNLTVSNPEVYHFLVEREDDLIEEWSTKAFVIGCVGLKQMILTENVDYVEKKFNDFIHQAESVFKNQSDQISEKIDDTFNLGDTNSPLYRMQNLILEYFDTKNGKFKSVIDEYFNEDEGVIRRLLDQTFDMTNTESAFNKLIENIKDISGKDENIIRDMLDPHKTDSPADMLKKEIFEKLKELKERDMDELMKSIQDMRDKEIKDIRDVVLKVEAIEEEKQKGTSKGLDFENLVYESFESITSSNEDIIEHVSEIISKDGKKGDILIDLDGDRKKRIVIECKDSSGYNGKETRTEIKQALENRDASYGIFLFAKQEQIPSNLRPIKITDSYVVTCMENDNHYFAYRLAKIFISQTLESMSETDITKINREIEKIEENLQNISTMQSKVSQIIKSGEYLRLNLQQLHDNTEISINKIQKYSSI